MWEARYGIRGGDSAHEILSHLGKYADTSLVGEINAEWRNRMYGVFVRSGGDLAAYRNAMGAVYDNYSSTFGRNVRSQFQSENASLFEQLRRAMAGGPDEMTALRLTGDLKDGLIRNGTVGHMTYAELHAFDEVVNRAYDALKAGDGSALDASLRAMEDFVERTASGRYLLPRAEYEEQSKQLYALLLFLQRRGGQALPNVNARAPFFLEMELPSLSEWESLMNEVNKGF